MTTTYKGLYYLNNVGLALLTRHQYNESMETFADAFYIHQYMSTYGQYATKTCPYFDNKNVI